MTFYGKIIGRKGEEMAVEFLNSHGFEIIQKNFRSKFGEIDIIARKHDKIYFVEVKTRTNLNKGKPYEAITPRKIHQLKKAATFFLLSHDYKKYKLTISVASIILTPQDSKFTFYESIG